ncbi:hypothetical protein M8J77_003074 [Diaphorina citri]|nr:hypothetical protein M8J77_003074 [Diaphorina citri]
MDAAKEEWWYESDVVTKYKFERNIPAVPKNACAGVRSLTPEESEQLNQGVEEAKRLEPSGYGKTHLLEHKIRLTNETPIRQKPYYFNPKMQEIVDQEVEKMLEMDVIQPSRSDWCNPLIMVKKPDGSYRCVLDFRKLNAVTERDLYPIGNITSILNSLKNCHYISTIDLDKAFWLIPLAPESRKYTAFQVKGNFYEFKVLTFGLTNSPGEFLRLVDQVLRGMGENVQFYIDDIIISTETMEEHLRLVKEVFRRLREANLRVNWKKCKFGASQVKFLGYIVDSEGLKVDSDKTKAIREYPPPRNVRELRRVLGMITWYKRFLPNYSKLLQPMTKLLKKKQPWKWGEEQEKALQELKNILTNPPVVRRPDYNNPEFIIETDASTFSIAACLMQRTKTDETTSNEEINGSNTYVIEYASRTLSKAERNYSVTELECLAVVWSLKKFRTYIEGGYKLIVVTDHSSLKWLYTMPKPTPKLCRWSLELQEYQIEFRHRTGKTHYIPDALSRVNFEPSVESEEIGLSVLATPDITAYEEWYDSKFRQVAEKPEENPNYRIESDLLYYHKLDPIELLLEDSSRVSWKLIPKYSELSRIYLENHDAEEAGHSGIIRTYNRITRYYYWPGMFNDIANYVRSCKLCQSSKARNERVPGGMMYKRKPEPGRVFYMDLMGKLPTSSHNNNYILVIQDDFTKYVEIVPLRNATGNTVSQHFKKVVLYRYGKPVSCISDNGTSFCNKLFDSLGAEFGFKHKKLAVYTPQANIVERSNRTIKQMIRCYVNERQTNWDSHLPELMFAINSSKQSTTGYSPNFLMFGREIEPIRHLRRDLEEDLDEPVEVYDYSGAVRKSQHLQEIYELVRINQLKASNKQARYYNAKRNVKVEYSEGDLVLKKNHKLSSGPAHYNAKLDFVWIGPCKVIQKITPVVYRLEDEHGVQVNYHIKDMKPFVPREEGPILDEEDEGC